MDKYLDAATRLHRHLVNQHWDGELLTGPDPGIRFNARIGRFVKGYLPFLPWKDELTYIQAQGYWIISNGTLSDITGDAEYTRLAETTAESLIARQTAAGYWDYPNPEWVGRIATVEGCFGAIGLADMFERTEDPRFLESALAWESYLRSVVGYRRQEHPDMLAVNYFAHVDDNVGGVPNNSTLVLWLLARLYEVTGAESYLDHTAPLAKWLQSTQLESGELPYFVGNARKTDRPHFLCQQYNAFEFMDLVHYQRITGDETVLPMMQRLAEFLSDGMTSSGYARYDCNTDSIEVTYYTAALSQALAQATALGFGDYSALSAAGYERVLEAQRADGSFRFYSKGNYRVAQDRRSYPRYLAMILHHLILAHRTVAVANGPA